MAKYKFFLFEDNEFPKGDDYKHALREDCRTVEIGDRHRCLGISLEEAIANHYHRDCDGWEDIWPLNFCLLTEDNEELCRFTAHQTLTFNIEEWKNNNDT